MAARVSEASQLSSSYLSAMPAIQPDTTVEKIKSVADDLAPYNFSLLEVEQIATYYRYRVKGATYYKNNNTALATSLWHIQAALISKDDKKTLPGLYILLKAKSPEAFIAKGGACRLTKAFHWESQQIFSFRSLVRTHLGSHEILLNRSLSQWPEYFTTGQLMVYHSTHTSRRLDETQVSEEKAKGEKYLVQHEKIGCILPYHQKGNLLTKIRLIHDKVHPPFSLQTKLRMALHMAQALQKVHQLGFTHFDFRPQNTLLTDDEENVTLIDFGNSLRSYQMYNVDGSSGSTAPEVLINKLSDIPCYVTPAIDVWSYGCFLALLFEKYAWNKWADANHLLGMTREGMIKPRIKQFFPGDDFPDSLIKRCLTFESYWRPSMATIIEELEKLQPSC